MHLFFLINSGQGSYKYYFTASMINLVIHHTMSFNFFATTEVNGLFKLWIMEVCKFYMILTHANLMWSRMTKNKYKMTRANFSRNITWF